MFSLALPSLILAALVIIHIVKTGRNTIWIYIVFLLPYAGILAYLFVEVLPGVLRSRQAQTLRKQLKKTLDPHADLRRHSEAVDIVDTVDNRSRLAHEYLQKGQYQAALEQYQSAARGIYASDAKLMLGMAEAYFGLTDYAACKQTLENLMQANPEFKSADGHLLFARCCAQLDDEQKAREEFEAVISYFSGPEAKVSYAEYLHSKNDTGRASALISEVLKQAKHSGRPYEKLHADALARAQKLQQKIG